MKKIILLLIASNFMLSCSDYLDVNSSTNNPHTSDLSPSDFLASALSTPYRTQANQMNEFGNVMTNCWASNVNAFTGGYREEFTLVFNTNSRSAIWDNLYTSLYNLNNILTVADPTNKYGNHKSIARIMKVYYMQYIVDIYGNAPYSDAFKGQDNLRPKYDDDKDIYKNLLSELDKARADITLYSTDTNVSIPTGSEDIMYRGDMTQWKAFANTLELKMVLRLSESTEADIVAIRTSRIANLSGKTFISSDATINPGYNGSASTEQNPTYQRWGANIDGSSAGTSRNSTVASQYIAKIMMGTQTNSHVDCAGIEDPRRMRIFATVTTGAITRGIIQGDVTVAAGGTAPVSNSRIGNGIMGYISPTGDVAENYNNGSGKDGYVMLKSESLFLQAEASLRYPSFGGTPKSLFQDAITASFEHYSLPVGTYTYSQLSSTAYLASTDNLLGLGWEGTPNKLEAIMTQKWIAMLGINGIEPYLDAVRTGFPNTPLAITAPVGSVRPKRLLYPASEYTANSANVPNVVLSQIFVKNQFTPFWVN
jgi:hypothetical protein